MFLFGIEIKKSYRAVGGIRTQDLNYSEKLTGCRNYCAIATFNLLSTYLRIKENVYLQFYQ